MRALVIGASGQVGRDLLRVLERGGIEAVGTYQSRAVNGSLKLDVRDADSVQRCLDNVRPDVVFLAVITRGGVDHCETHPEEAQAVNVAGTRIVATAAARCGVRIIYYSSDYIFDGREGPYSEDARPCPINVYGRTKWEAEQIIQELTLDYLIIRTTAVFGWNRTSRNFAMQVWERVGAGNSMRVPQDQWCNPTLVDYLADVSVRLIEKGVAGIFNVVGKDWMPRSEFARALARAMALDPVLIIPTPTSQSGQQAPRPLRGGLTTHKLEGVLGAEPPDLNESLMRFRRQWMADKGIT